MKEPLVLSPLNGQPNRRKVAIIGLDGLTSHDAPWSDDAWDIWGLNSGHQVDGLHRDHQDRFRADRWFQIHPWQTWSPDERSWFDILPVSTVTMVADADRTFLLAQDYALRDRLSVYPLDRVRQRFPRTPLLSSFCLMIALALVEEYEEIGLFGTESRGIGRELLLERGALLYWMGRAEQRGVTVTLSPRSTLKPCPYVYGFDYYDEAQYVAACAQQLLPERWIRALRVGSNLDTVQQVEQAAIENAK